MDGSLLDKRFLYRLFNWRHVRELIQATATGAKVKHTAPVRLRQLALDIPSVGEQKAIAYVLDSYDDLIVNNQRRIALLEDAARRIYREWFVNLRFPGHESVPIRNGIPEGWVVKSLGDVAPLNYGKSLRSEDRKVGDVPVFGSSGIVGSHDSSIVAADSIIVGRKGNVGSLYYSYFPFWPIDTVYYVAPSDSCFRLFLNLHDLNFISSDAAVPGLNRTYAHSLPLLIPTLDVAERFETAVKPFFLQVRDLTLYNSRLAQARDMLLPKLMSGEIDVSGIPLPEEVVE